MLEWMFALLLVFAFGGAEREPGATGTAPSHTPDLERIAVAVEGAESSRGTDRSMWRPKPAGPQGPMQVSAAAAADVGDGDRFDPEENRRLGRAYLALLFGRYGNWEDAVTAYNWGPGNFDRWVAAGRPPSAISLQLQAYLNRVMREFLAVAAAGAAPPRPAPAEPPIAEIRDPSLRKSYLANRAAIEQLRGFLEATKAGEGVDPGPIRTTIRLVAMRRGYEQFADLRGSRSAGLPSVTGLREIVTVLTTKLEAECAAIALVDQRRHREGSLFGPKRF